MNDIVGTKQPVGKEKATETVKFRLTPTQHYLEKQMVEEMIKLGCAHNKTDAWLWLLKNWRSIEQAKRFMDLQKQAEQLQKQASALTP